MPARSLCRPHLGPHDARQPVAAVVRLNGLRPDLRLASYRLGSYPVRPRLVRHDPPQALENRSAGAYQRAPSPCPLPLPIRPSTTPFTPRSPPRRPDEPDRAARMTPQTTLGTIGPTRTRKS